MFPKISRSIAAANLDEARHDLVSALNNVGLLIMFFAAAMVVFPEPIIRALLPSVSEFEGLFIGLAEQQNKASKTGATNNVGTG